MAAARLVILLAAAAIAAPAVAQVAPSAPVAPDRGHGPSPERREEWRAHRQAHEAQEAADVALLLRLRPDQKVAYQQWRDSVRPHGEEGRGDRMHDRGDEDATAPQTTPQELDRMQAKMAELTTRERARADATRRFYGSLGPEQQALFDALMRLRRGGHGGGEGRMHGGPPMGGEGGPPPPPGA